MTYTEKELDQFLHGISLSLLSKKSAQHWRYDEETAKEIEWLEALERKVRADKADHKTENSSEKPNSCELQTIRCPKCGRTDYIRDMEKDMGIKDSHYKYKCINCNFYIKTEPTSSKMEQVDKDINVRSKEEPHIVGKHADMVIIDESQAELVRVKYHCINCAENGSYKCSKCDGEMYYKYDKDEPQRVSLTSAHISGDIYHKWETPPKFEHKGDITTCVSVPAWAFEDEQKTEREDK